MKVNVKGLVFVGFAAAILSASAMAGDGDQNIVTSKAYTDATYQAKLGGTNKAGIVKSSTTAGDVSYVDIADEKTDITGLTSNSTAAATGALTTAGAVKAALDDINTTATTEFTGATAGADGAAGIVPAPVTGEQNSYLAGGGDWVAPASGFTNVNGGTNADDNKLPTASAVKTYADSKVGGTVVSTNTTQAPTGATIASALDDKVTKNTAITGATHTKITYDAKGLVTAGTDLVASDLPAVGETTDAGKVLVVGNDGKISVGTATESGTYQPEVGGGTNDTKAHVGNGDNSWLEVKDTTYVEMEKGTDGNKDVMRVQLKSGAINTDGTGIGSFADSSATGAGNLTTAYAVQEAIDTALTGNGGVSDTYQEKSTAQSIGNSTGTWDTFANGTYTSLTRTGSDANGYTVTVDIPASVINNSGTLASGLTNQTGTDLVTEYTLQQAMASQPASKIPDQNTTVCTSSQPCALVAGATSFHWITMATGTHGGGVCGDAGTNQTCEGLGTAPTNG